MKTIARPTTAKIPDRRHQHGEESPLADDVRALRVGGVVPHVDLVTTAWVGVELLLLDRLRTLRPSRRRTRKTACAWSGGC